MTTTYSEDADVNARLELDDLDFKNLSKEDVIDKMRVSAFRDIIAEYLKMGGTAPTPTEVTALSDIDPQKVLIDVEADWAAAEFRENKIEFSEDARPDRDKSKVWRARGMKKLKRLLRHLHGENLIKVTREDP